MAQERRQSVTKIEVFTEEHHLVGYVSTGGRRLSTWLNVEDAPMFTLESVTLRSLRDVEQSEVKLEYVLVNRRPILAVIPREAPVVSMEREREQRPPEYVDKEKHAVVVSVPPFALRGHIHLARSADLYRTLNALPGSFIPVTEARVIYTPHPEFLWEGEVVLVNRDKAQLYWPAGREPKGQGEA